MKALHFFITPLWCECLFRLGSLQELGNSSDCVNGGFGEMLRRCPCIQWLHPLAGQMTSIHEKCWCINPWHLQYCSLWGCSPVGPCVHTQWDLQGVYLGAVLKLGLHQGSSKDSLWPDLKWNHSSCLISSAPDFIMDLRLKPSPSRGVWGNTGQQ